MKPKNKREVPLSVLQAVEPFIIKDKKPFDQVLPDDAWVLIHDPEWISPFFFRIDDVSLTDNQIFVIVSQKPASANSIDIGKEAIGIGALDKRFDNWKKLVEDYNNSTLFQKEDELERQKTSSIEEDELLKQYAVEEQEWFIPDVEEVGARVYPLTVQLFLDNYFSSAIKSLEAYKESHELSEDQIEEVDHIIESAKDIKQNQTKLNIKEVGIKLTWYAARARKAGIAILKEIKTEVFKETMKAIAKALVENAGDLPDIIKGALE